MYSAKRNRPAVWIYQGSVRSVCAPPPGPCCGAAARGQIHPSCRTAVPGRKRVCLRPRSADCAPGPRVTIRLLPVVPALRLTTGAFSYGWDFLLRLGLLLAEEEHRAAADQDQRDRDTR